MPGPATAEKIQDTSRRPPSLDAAVTSSENPSMRRYFFSILAVMALSGPPVQTQSLGDVARQEEARRKAVQPSGRVYTNDSLRAEGGQPAPVPQPPTPDAASKPAAPNDAAKPKPDAEIKDEKYWRTRITTEREALSRAETFAEALQSRVNALTADFAARDDPFQRNQVGTERQKALAELDRVRKEVAAHTKAIADTQEEARKARVPAGWLR